MIAALSELRPLSEHTRTAVAVLCEGDTARTAGGIHDHGHVFPVRIVIEEHPTLVVGVEKPVLHVDPAVGARVDVYIGDPVAGIGATSADVDRQSRRAGVDTSDARQ